MFAYNEFTCKDYDSPNQTQIDFAIEEIKRAGFEIIELGWRSSVYEISINTLPNRTLCICFRDEDYWVRCDTHVGMSRIWPGKGQYGFQIKGAFRKALHVLISGKQI
jgi:hypothetical protein